MVAKSEKMKMETSYPSLRFLYFLSQGVFQKLIFAGGCFYSARVFYAFFTQRHQNFANM